MKTCLSLKIIGDALSLSLSLSLFLFSVLTIHKENILDLFTPGFCRNTKLNKTSLKVGLDQGNCELVLKNEILIIYWWQNQVVQIYQFFAATSNQKSFFFLKKWKHNRFWLLVKSWTQFFCNFIDNVDVFQILLIM